MSGTLEDDLNLDYIHNIILSNTKNKVSEKKLKNEFKDKEDTLDQSFLMSVIKEFIQITPPQTEKTKFVIEDSCLDQFL